jgi:hypothetical protein
MKKIFLSMALSLPLVANAAILDIDTVITTSSKMTLSQISTVLKNSTPSGQTHSVWKEGKESFEFTTFGELVYDGANCKHYVFSVDSNIAEGVVCKTLGSWVFVK